ncbi:MAG TPA: glycosyltransferase [Anaeromyxobacteraceae bacterium]|nr:glycosyltransferase [Anaeromyxobacteraceae bacterium]
MPRVAVLMPARDARRTVVAAARSILRQSMRDLALVAVEDGSRDDTAAVLFRLAEGDRRVLVVRGKGEGIAVALNLGLQRCDAEVVARMDADDLAHPRRLECQLAALVALPEAWAVGSQVRPFPRREIGVGMRRYVEWVNGLTSPEQVARDLLVEAPLVHPASALRREALERLSGWRDGPFPEDYDLWLRACEAGGVLSNVARPLLLWRDGPGRATRQDPRYRLARFVALKCGYLRRTVLAGRDEVALWGAGPTGKAFADALREEGVRVALFLDVDKKKVGRVLRGATVLSYEEAARARGLPLLVAVGSPGARPLIRRELARRGFTELRDYWCVS